MAWLAAIVVLLLLVFSAGFRKLAAVVAALLAAAVAIFILAQQQSQREARGLIPSSDVELREIKLQSDSFGSYKLVGRIKNNSPSHTLTELGLKILLEDCDAEMTDIPRTAAVIGAQNLTKLNVSAALEKARADI